MQADPAVLEVVSPLDSPRRRLNRLVPEPLRFGLIGADGDQFRLRGRLGRVVERLGPGWVDVEDRSHGHPVNLSRLERDPVTLGRGRDEWLGQARPVTEEGVVHVGPFQLRVLQPVGAGNLRFDLFHDVAICGFGLARAEHLGDEEVCQSAAGVAHLVGVLEGDLVGPACRQQGVAAALEPIAGVSDAARGEQCLGRRGRRVARVRGNHPGAGRGDVLERHPRVAAIEDERHILGLLRQEGKQPPQLVGADVENLLGATIVRDDRADLPRGRLAGGVFHARAVAAVVEDDNGIIRRPADEVVLEGLNDGGVGGLLVGKDPDRVVRKVKFAPEQSLHVAHVGDAAGEAVDGFVFVDTDQQR